MSAVNPHSPAYRAYVRHVARKRGITEEEAAFRLQHQGIDGPPEGDSEDVKYVATRARVLAQRCETVDNMKPGPARNAALKKLAENVTEFEREPAAEQVEALRMIGLYAESET